MSLSFSWKKKKITAKRITKKPHAFLLDSLFSFPLCPLVMPEERSQWKIFHTWKMLEFQQKVLDQVNGMWLVWANPCSKAFNYIQKLAENKPRFPVLPFWKHINYIKLEWLDIRQIFKKKRGEGGNSLGKMTFSYISKADAFYLKTAVAHSKTHSIHIDIVWFSCFCCFSIIVGKCFDKWWRRVLIFKYWLENTGTQ